MRIVQIIDSLNVGGAEKMAVNYANSLASELEFSALVATREEGLLKNQIQSNVEYLFLEKNRKIDVSAVKRLKSYCKENRVNYIHPHGSSYFIAFLLKLIYPKIKIVWHCHYGLMEFWGMRKLFFLKLSSLSFSGIITVNNRLEEWAKNKLHCKNVIYLPNYTSVDSPQTETTKLLGIEGKRILCLANLRYQKNHFLLLEVAEKLQESHPDWSFHLVGNDLNDDYSEKIKTIIKERQLGNVFIYGVKNDTANIIKQSEITILTSDTEGLPVALVEYGLLAKPTVSTNVGEIPLMIKNNENGFIVPVKNSTAFYEALVKLTDDENLRVKFGQNFYKTISENNSEEAVIKKYLSWVKSL